MHAVSVYRSLLAVRAGWFLLAWFFGWGISEHSRSFASTHPDAAVIAEALGAAFTLTILAGLWFFRRWARLLFLILCVVGIAYGAFRVHQPRSMPPVSLRPIISFIVMANGAIVAMSFLPPVRDMFTNRPNHTMQPTASPRTASVSDD
jgi:hypothetical protein